jgi:beta-carotene 3-hydroxylase
MLSILLLILLAFTGMEFIAWVTHKYVMHGLMWHWHSDHHHKDHESSFERNDIFFVIYATPGIMCILLGSIAGFSSVFFIGLGISLYGLTYFLIHDIFIHQRFKIFRETRIPYLLALRKAHKAHHKIKTKHDGTCFGMLLVPKKYYLQAQKLLYRS